MFVIEDLNYGGIDWHDDRTVVQFITKSETEFGYETKEEAIAKLKAHIIETITADEHVHADADKLSEILDKVGIPFEDGTAPKYSCPVDSCRRESDYKIEKRLSKTGRIINRRLRNKGYSAKAAYAITGRILEEKRAIAKEWKYAFPDKYENEDGTVTYENEYHFTIDDKGRLTVTSDCMWGQASYTSHYYITEVKNPVYAVIENFLSPNKYYDSIERLWCEPFASYEDALAYKNNFVTVPDWETDVYIACFDLDSVNKDWYANQMKVLDLLKKAELSIHDIRTFSPWTERHAELLEEFIAGQAS